MTKDDQLVNRDVTLFLDTEFTSLDRDSELLSMAIYESKDKYCYLEITDYDTDKINDWLAKNVIAKFNLEQNSHAPLAEKYACALPFSEVGQVVRTWLDKFYSNDKVTICSDCYAWDWLHFCDLFGGARSLPSYIHYIPLDLATILEVKGLDRDLGRVDYASELTRDTCFEAHNALSDAKAMYIIYNHLMK